MNKEVIRFTKTINASREKVWDVLLNDETYRKWASAFYPGSYAETDWKEGSDVLFKGPEGDGVISKIVKHQPGEIISFEHQGILKGGRPDLENEEIKNWQGFRETYTATSKDGQTELIIEQEMVKEYVDTFSRMWEKALENIQRLAEEK